MTVRIAGLWELGWNTPIKEIDLWEYPLRDFGVEKLLMTPVSGIDHSFVEESPTLHDILENNSGYTAVFCDERASTPLTDFLHPDKALYVFGKATYSPFLSLKRPEDLELRINTPNNQGLLWPHQAAVIILYDRFIKKHCK